MEFRDQETNRALECGAGGIHGGRASAPAGLQPRLPDCGAQAPRGLKPALRLALAALLAAAALAMEPAREFRYDVLHDHWRKSGAGELVISERGISYRENGKKEHTWNWKYDDIQQLRISPREIRVLTYEDVRWKLGLDREHEFRAAGRSFEDGYQYLKDRLDQRFIAVLADPAVEPLWRLPAKLKERFGGTEGELIAADGRIIFRSGREGKSRTWRYADIDDISSSGPFELTVTSFERSRGHYGSRKGFTFQLKQALGEARYDSLWRRLNQAKGLGISFTQGETQ